MTPSSTREYRDLRSFLEGIVENHRDEVALVDSRGRLTYEELDHQINRVANMFASLGVSKGDRVALLLPNCREYLCAWFGLAKLGAVHVPLNVRIKGEPLKHQLQNSDPLMAVVDDEYLEDFLAACDGRFSGDRLVIRRNSKANLTSAIDMELASKNASSEPPPWVDIHPGDPLVIMYTSGTTGPAKGVVNCHNAYTRIATDLAEAMGLIPDDRMYVFLPLYHGNPQMMGVMPILAAGGSIALAERFSATRFWDEVRRFGTTVFTHIGSPLSILMKQEERPEDGDNPVRLILGGAPPEVSSAFSRRFQCTVLDGWGMIEAGCNTTITPVGRNRPGTNGFPRDCFDVRILDENDEEVAPGTPGEIVVRPREPYVMFSGYFRTPEQTLSAFRNLWFHSGDLGMKDQEGSLYFLGRSDDAIRRKGENISAMEIESALMAHPGVTEVAVVGVPDEIAGQEIKACLVTVPGSVLTPEQIISWCEPRLPDYMLPRYVVFKSQFEKTGSEKIQRFKLRENGVQGAWDREAQIGAASAGELTVRERRPG